MISSFKYCKEGWQDKKRRRLQASTNPFEQVCKPVYAFISRRRHSELLWEISLEVLVIQIVATINFGKNIAK